MNTNFRSKWVFLIPVVLLVCLTFQVPGEDSRPENDELKPVREVYRLILNNYYDPESIDKDELIQGAIEGMLDRLPDEYHEAYTQEEYKEYRRRQEGNYVGIGMQIEKSGDRVRVISVFPDTPASRNGLTSGDVILEVEGKSTRNLSFTEVFEALDGEEGTTVRVTVRHLNDSEETINLTRTNIEITPVELKMIEGDKIALIDINLFNRQTARELEQVFNQLDNENLIGYVLDLRNNSGGWLNSAIEVASQFVDRGLITKTVGPDGTREYESRGNSNPNLPLVVLINDGTASASELVAGAVRDHGMGVLVGRRSFGKGLVQTTHTVGRGIRVKLSTSEYLTPGGTRLNENGLAPDIESEERSGDLTRAIEWIREHRGGIMPLGKKEG
ncbi:S41 family peptidase [Candidatus Bipolaricaulota bacterium]|nr:S41 family peptidase [Candidatus Bipolaricaulota bacterium]